MVGRVSGAGVSRPFPIAETIVIRGPSRQSVHRCAHGTRRTVRPEMSRSAAEPTGRAWTRVVPDVLCLAVLVETGLAQLAADARLLEPTPLGLGQVCVVV